MTELLNEFLPGVASIPNLHPLVVHFPLALFPSFLLLELIALPARSDLLRHAATWMLYLGTLGAAAAVLAGFHAEETVDHSEEVHAIMERHETYGLAVLGMGLTLSLWRMLRPGRVRGLNHWAQLASAFVLVGMMVQGADLGGLMVYQHAVAVRAAMECGPDQSAPKAEVSSSPSMPIEQQEAAGTPDAPPAVEDRPHRHRHTHSSGGHRHAR